MLSWLPWQDAAEMAGATAATWTVTRRSPRSWARALRPWAKELTLILVLYGMWQYAGAWSLGRRSVALSRGRTIWDVERDFYLPSERSVQDLVLHLHLLMRALNEYYAVVHVPALAACLIWLFVRHRDRYPEVRTVVALVTGASLVIQMFPVAPPRLLPNLGVVDTGALIGPNVYARGAPGLDQLSAMPSLHVAWAIVVAGAVIWVSRSRGRWLALLYPALTTFAVVVTGNHYWADAIVAAVLCAGATIIVARAYAAPRIPPAASTDPSPERVLEPAALAAHPSVVARLLGAAVAGSLLLVACSGSTAHPEATTTSPACPSASLAASVEAFAAAVGHDYYLVVLTNAGAHACTLAGIPSVSFLDANHQEIGAPAAPSGTTGSPVTLATDQPASAELVTTPPLCDSGQVPTSTYVSVMPPAQTAALTVPGAVALCDPTIMALKAGTRPPAARS
jgi:PAP2 superfamily/Protein of unknown function (DUF4232)